MKNIHLLLTGKPSRLWEDEFGISRYGNESFFYTGCTWKNIYITSDEEIKEGYYLDLTHNIIMKSVFYPSSDKNCKKIILTTDQSLDGIQAIDDEFLEWFVKNPTCEEVEVELIDTFKKTNEVYVDEITGGNYYEIIKKYKIIIPKEEPKQIKCYCGHTTYCDCGPLEEPRKETLKEAAEKLYQEGLQNDLGLSFHDGVKFGAKWQQERMYSEEEVEQIARFGFNAGRRVELKAVDLDFTFEKWFEKFKNK